MIPEIVLWRIRNRIIEYLDLAASAEHQLAYQAAVPRVDVPSEVANQWEDWVRPDWRQYLKPPVFSDEELDAIGCHQGSVAATRRLARIDRVGRATRRASAALDVFRTRGHRPEADLDERS